jgi:hypothetical protein
MTSKTGLGGILLMTMACAPVPPAEPGEEPVPVHGATGYRCDASRAQALVGRQATSELGAEALRLTGARAIRWIPPGAIVTMDYREDRLNIELDGRNRVTQLRCG